MCRIWEARSIVDLSVSNVGLWLMLKTTVIWFVVCLCKACTELHRVIRAELVSAIDESS